MKLIKYIRTNKCNLKNKISKNVGLENVEENRVSLIPPRKIALLPFFGNHSVFFDNLYTLPF